MMPSSFFYTSLSYSLRTAAGARTSIAIVFLQDRNVRGSTRSFCSRVHIIAADYVHGCVKVTLLFVVLVAFSIDSFSTLELAFSHNHVLLIRRHILVTKYGIQVLKQVRVYVYVRQKVCWQPTLRHEMYLVGKLSYCSRQNIANLFYRGGVAVRTYTLCKTWHPLHVSES